MILKKNDRRLSTRLPFVTKVSCNVKGTDGWRNGILRDISISGLFIEMDECPESSSQCSIRIIFEGDHSRLMIDNISGEIRRSDQRGVGIRFNERLEWFILIPLFFHKVSGKMKNENNSFL